MEWIKNDKYEFDFNDITTLILCVAVALILCGFYIVSTIIFVINCIIGIIFCITKVKRFNILILNIALLILNLSFFW